MFEECENSLYKDLFTGLKKAFSIQRNLLSFQLVSLWDEMSSWNLGGQSISCGTKTVSLKVGTESSECFYLMPDHNYYFIPFFCYLFTDVKKSENEYQ